MPTLGTITYPTSFSAIRRSPELMRAFARFAADSSDRTYRTSMMYCSGDFSIVKRYLEFHSAKAPLKMKLKPELQEALDSLVLTSWAKNAKKIEVIYADIEKALLKELDGKVLDKFYASEEFREHHCRSMTGYKVIDDVFKVAAEKLKLSKEKNVAVLKKVLQEAVFGSTSKAKGLSKDLSKSGLLGVLGNRDVYKELEKNVFL